MKLIISNLKEILFQNEVQKVTLPGKAGAFQVLENHAPLITVLQKGTIRYSIDEQEYTFEIKHDPAQVEVLDNIITVLIQAPLS